MEWVSQQFDGCTKEQNGYCMAACVAMVTNSSLQQVREACHFRFNRDHNFYYIPDKELVRFLANRYYRLGMRADLSQREIKSYYEDIAVYIPLQVPAILTVESRNFPDVKHAVVWDPELRKIRDPQIEEPQELNEYKVFEWDPVTDL